MDFDFSDDQVQLRDAVRRWADKSYSFERRRSIVKAGGWSAEAWGELAELGLTGLAVAPDHNGLGFGPVEAMVTMEELGRALVVEPYAHVALVASALLGWSRAELAGPWLEGIADGQARVVLAHQERQARYHLNHVFTRAVQAGGQWTLSGIKHVVPMGGEACGYIVPARVSGSDADPAGIALFLVRHDAAGLRRPAYPLQDGSAASDLVLADTPAEELLGAGPAYAALEHALDIGIAALAAEAVGAMERVVELTAEYLNTRRQFGVPISSFQALRHRLADMKMQLELARSMSYYATLKLGELPDTRRRALSQAKVQIGQSARYVGQQAIQLHGGIGVTDEYLVGHYFKRLTCIELSFGDTLHHLGEVAARAHDTAGVFA
ncbi:MAG: acyl-CoA dehydrogenase [Aquabacterium sp.]|nr:MAG: acyl-CoA dehydrogenase [Aquabacterium sp.]